ncbi:MAG: AMP-binding protein, partial [Pseudomonadota bacterium]
DLGVGQGGFVAIMLDSSCDAMICAHALQKLSAIEIAVNATFRGRTLVRMLELADCELLITSTRYLPHIEACAADLPKLRRIVMIDMGFKPATSGRFEFISLEKLRSDCTDNFNPDQRDDATAMILFTSGTTGTAKGCIITHRGAVRAGESMMEAFDLDENDCVYSPYPLFHVGALHYDILPALLLGARVVIRNGFDVRQFWPDVARFNVSWFMALGSVQQLLWAAPPNPWEQHHRLRYFWGTPLPVDPDAFEQRFKVKVMRGGGYGSTDAGAVALPMADKRGAGRIRDRYKVAILDQHDDRVPDGTTGELCLRPNEPAIMASGYFGAPEATVAAWRNGWFHTGDLARLDGDGDLIFVARKAERLRIRGQMVTACEIEEAILAHPSVEDCAVIPQPDGLGEEVPIAIVSLRSGAMLDYPSLVAFCRGKISSMMYPQSLQIIDQMPRTPSGKPARAELIRIYGSASHNQMKD